MPLSQPRITSQGNHLHLTTRFVIQTIVIYQYNYNYYRVLEAVHSSRALRLGAHQGVLSPAVRSLYNAVQKRSSYLLMGLLAPVLRITQSRVPLLRDFPFAIIEKSALPTVMQDSCDRLVDLVSPLCASGLTKSENLTLLYFAMIFL